MVNESKRDHWFFTFCRLLMGITFIVSAFLKAVDPVATGIKVNEYLISFGFSGYSELSFWLGILQNTGEFIIGFALIFRLKMKISSWAIFLFMGFFLLLTGWLALAEYLETVYPDKYNFGVVKDCGCFGQAIEMNNLHTFLKNVVFMVFTLPIFINRNRWRLSRQHDFIQICIGFIGVIIICIIQWLNYICLPWIDFSDWKKGTSAAALFLEKPEEKEIIFIYQNNQDNTQHIYTTAELMEAYGEMENFEDIMSFVERKDSVISPLIHAQKPGFTMLDSIGRDYSGKVLTDTNEIYLIMMPDLSKIGEKQVRALQLLSDKKIFAVTNSSFKDIEDFQKTYALNFPILHNEIDAVKGPFVVRDAIRANPGIIVLKNGVVMDKMSWRQLK